MIKHRLEFFYGDEVVGHFHGRGYPAAPGRYRYSPYRGIGHARFAKAIRKSKLAECVFYRRRKKVALTISEEEFVPGKTSQWFVTVTQVG